TMNMMRKMSLLALAVCAAGAVSTAAHADDKSWGTASAKVTVNAAQEWTIAKKQDGVMNLTSSGIPSVSAQGGNAAGQRPMFTISNKTQTAGVFYIKGNGDSLGSENYIYMVNDEDATKKTYLQVFKGTSDYGLTWDETAVAWRGPSVTAGASQDISLATKATSEKVPAGKYTVTLELFAPSV
ncbi:hypothetical protein ACSN7O_004704, partial [Enterobacter chuandaensis]